MGGGDERDERRSGELLRVCVAGREEEGKGKMTEGEKKLGRNEP